MFGLEFKLTHYHFSVHLDRVAAMLLPPASGPTTAGEQSVESGELVSVLREMVGAIRVLAERLEAQTDLLRDRLPDSAKSDAPADSTSQASPQRKPAKPASP
jgi:hypothetical protein